MYRCHYRFNSRNISTSSSVIAITASFLLMASSASHANLIRNASFEDVPNSNIGQGLMPSEWVTVNSSPDTYSNDGSYGIQVGDFGNFTGVSAYDGIRWVAGWSSAVEQFGQLLTSALTPGQDYTFSAYMHQALRSDLNHPGGYDLYLRSSSNNATDQALLGNIGATSTGDWSLFQLSFIAPDNAAALPFLMFDPAGVDGLSTYPGLDLVSLNSTVVPLPAAFWLFTAGIAGLAGFTRRKST